MACENCKGLKAFYCPVCQPTGTRVKALEAEIARLRAELEAANARVTEGLKESQSLRNLLAIIHRDGGHYGTAHGIDKAVGDGMTLVTHTRAALDAAKARIAKVREVAQANAYLVSSDVVDILNGKEVERV